MANAPKRIGDFVVLYYTVIDSRHRFTGRTQHRFGTNVQNTVAGLAICGFTGDANFYLLYCNHAWDPINDSTHPTLAEAKHQAEQEFAGSAKTWVDIQTE